jgi:hypothetical protein
MNIWRERFRVRPVWQLAWILTGAAGSLGAQSVGCAVAQHVVPVCIFARATAPSGSTAGEKDVINTPSQILSAPPGGLWWIIESGDQTRVVAQGGELGPIELEVTARDQSYFVSSSILGLRVPQNLLPGTVLTLGTTTLRVVAPTSPVNLADIVVARSYRSDVGGTGFTIRVPPGAGNSVFIHRAYVVQPSGNVAGGVLVLQDLLVADAPRLCPLSPPVDDEMFVPVQSGAPTTSALVIILADANDGDLAFVRTERLLP